MYSVILVDSEEELVSEANKIASEHVQVLTKKPDLFLNRLTNADLRVRRYGKHATAEGSR